MKESILYNTKIHVRGEEESLLLQRYLFSQGCRWWGGEHKTPIHTDKKYIFIDNRVEMSQSDSDSHFKAHRNKELSLEVIKTVELTEVLQETVELNNKVYLKSDLEAALNKLTPVEN